MQKERGLFENVREYGCPMMDDTPWLQSQSGEFFTSPAGIATAAFWLPCGSSASGPVLPGTCESCVSYNRARLATDPHPSEPTT